MNPDGGRWLAVVRRNGSSSSRRQRSFETEEQARAWIIRTGTVGKMTVAWLWGPRDTVLDGVPIADVLPTADSLPTPPMVQVPQEFADVLASIDPQDGATFSMRLPDFADLPRNVADLIRAAQELDSAVESTYDTNDPAVFEAQRVLRAAVEVFRR